MYAKKTAAAKVRICSKIKYPSLRRFIHILESIESGNISNIRDLNDDALIRATQELLDAGLLSQPQFSIGSGAISVGFMCLTPAGALALVEWQDYVERKSIRGRFIAVSANILMLAIATIIGGRVLN